MSAMVLRSLVGMRYGPVAVCSLSVLSSLCTPAGINLLLYGASVGVGWLAGIVYFFPRSARDVLHQP